MKNKMREILILGGSSDIGLDVVKIFLKEGWKVYAHYKLNVKKLKFLKKIYKQKLITIQSDLFKENSVKKLIKKISKGNIVAFINLVGYLDHKSFENFDIKSIIKSLKINTINPLLIQRYLIRNMIKNKFGRILNISSIGVKYGGSKFTFDYSFSKHAIEYFPKYLKELTKLNILNNVLRIGVVNTKLLKKVKSKDIAKRISLIPIKRLAETEEIAKMIYNLSSEKNSFISGEIISIAGGE